MVIILGQNDGSSASFLARYSFSMQIGSISKLSMASPFFLLDPVVLFFVLSFPLFFSSSFYSLCCEARQLRLGDAEVHLLLLDSPDETQFIRRMRLRGHVPSPHAKIAIVFLKHAQKGQVQHSVHTHTQKKAMREKGRFPTSEHENLAHKRSAPDLK